MESRLSINKNRFLIKRSDLTTLKLFVEFYLPEYQDLLGRLRQSPYPLLPLKVISKRMFDGPFGSNRKVDMYQDDGIPFIRVKDVLPGRIESNGLTYISQQKHDELVRSRVVPGNVLLTIAGRLGTAAVFPEELVEGNITGHIVGIEPKENINPHYLALFLNSFFGEFQVTRWGHRTTRPELNLREVGEILVTAPPLEVQDSIAQMMQDAYAAHQAKLIKAQQLQTTMDEWALNFLETDFTKADPPKYFKVPSTCLDKNRWDALYHSPPNPILADNKNWCTLESYASVIRETATPSRNPNQAFYYVAIQDMSNDPFSVEDNAQTVRGGELNGLCKQFTGGDILLARLGPSIGNKKSAITPLSVEVGYCSPEFLVIRPKLGVDRRFLLWLVKSQLLIRQMLTKTRGATPSRARLYSEDLLQLRVPIASSNQQEIIGQEIENRRHQIKQLRRDAGLVVKAAKEHVEHMILGTRTMA